MIAERVMKYKSDLRRNSPANSNRASSMGIPCERRLVYERVAHDKKELHSVETQARFDVGNWLEMRALRDIQDAGFKVINFQSDFKDPRSQITGHIDAIVEVDDTRYPIEIKSMATAIFNSIENLQDLNKYFWTRRYFAQLQMYLFLSEYEIGILYLMALDGRVKEIFPVKLDIDYVDGLLKKADRVNNHIRRGTLPPYTTDHEECQNCPFKGWCGPPLQGTEGQDFIDDPALVEALEVWNETKPYHSDYNRAYNRIKAYVGERPMVIAGDWLIQRKEDRAGRMQTKIERLGQGVTR